MARADCVAACGERGAARLKRAKRDYVSRISPRVAPEDGLHPWLHPCAPPGRRGEGYETVNGVRWLRLNSYQDLKHREHREHREHRAEREAETDKTLNRLNREVRPIPSSSSTQKIPSALLCVPLSSLRSLCVNLLSSHLRCLRLPFAPSRLQPPPQPPIATGSVGVLSMIFFTIASASIRSASASKFKITRCRKHPTAIFLMSLVDT